MVKHINDYYIWKYHTMGVIARIVSGDKTFKLKSRMEKPEVVLLKSKHIPKDVTKDIYYKIETNYGVERIIYLKTDAWFFTYYKKISKLKGRLLW